MVDTNNNANSASTSTHCESADQGEYQSVRHIYTEWQPEVHDTLGSWREFIETYSLESGRRV